MGSGQGPSGFRHVTAPIVFRPEAEQDVVSIRERKLADIDQHPAEILEAMFLGVGRELGSRSSCRA